MADEEDPDAEKAFRELIFAEDTTLQGTILSYSEKSLWGFVNHPDFCNAGLTASEDKGIFFHGKDVRNALVPLKKGQEVFFNLQKGPDGKPQAVKLSPVEAGAVSSSSERKIRDDKVLGKVVAFNPKSAWGFVEAPDLKSLYANDIFFHIKDFPSADQWTLVKGEEVYFIVDDKTKPEKPQARQVEYASASKGPKVVAPPPGASPQRGSGPGEYQGTVLSWSSKSAWGFLTSPSLPSDVVEEGKGVFCHIKDFRNVGAEENHRLRAGQKVSFNFRIDIKDGKPHAKEAYLLDGAGSSKGAGSTGGGKGPPASARGQWVQGTVMSYTESKAWGFVSAPNLASELGGPGVGVFFHLKDFVADPNHQAPYASLRVWFTFEIDQKGGRPQAKQVTPADPGSPGGPVVVPASKSHGAKAAGKDNGKGAKDSGKGKGYGDWGSDWGGKGKAGDWSGFEWGVKGDSWGGKGDDWGKGKGKDKGKSKDWGSDWGGKGKGGDWDAPAWKKPRWE